MQYVNDDMDELFRRAAENYPLDTNSADWNKVLAAMQGTEATKKPPEKKRNKNGRFLWLLLLLPLVLIYNQLYSPGRLSNKETAKAVQKENRINKKQSGENSNLNPGPGNAASSDVHNERTEPKAATEVPAVLLNKNNKHLSSPVASYTSNNKYSSNNKFSKANKFNTDKGTDAFSSGQKENDFVAKTGLPTELSTSERRYLSSIFFQALKTGAPVTTVNKDLSPVKNPLENASKKPQSGRSRNQFYIGLTGAIDATTIKFQKIRDAGFSYGLLVGKELNKNWSVQVGYFMEKKYYYSEGKYFNTSKLTMPPNSRIADVSGNCKMIEVPLTVKYNFSSRQNSEWFATLGSSSYFMKEERYSYNYYYGSVGPVPHYRKYKNSSSNLFSNISLSAGYAHQLGNSSSYLRVEPYVKFPISGMGIGKLPLFSTGLQLSVVKKF